MLRLTKSAPTTFEPTGMLVTNVDVTYGGDTQSWASALVEEIKTGSYQFAAAGWISCSSTTQPWTVEDDVKKILNARQFPFQVTPLACPIVWAKESNAFDCVCLRCLFLLKSLTDEETSRMCSSISPTPISAPALTLRQVSQS
jgi:hypothetical protein